MALTGLRMTRILFIHKLEKWVWPLCVCVCGCVCVCVCVGRGEERVFWQITHSSYSTHQASNLLRHPELSFSQQHFSFKMTLFLPHLPASKTLTEEQIFWGTDPMSAPSKRNIQGHCGCPNLKKRDDFYIFTSHIWKNRAQASLS